MTNFKRLYRIILVAGCEPSVIRSYFSYYLKTRNAMPKRKRQQVYPVEHVLSSPSLRKRPKRAVQAAKEQQKFKFALEWDSFGTISSKGLPQVLQLTGPAVKGSKKIAAFDLDYTWVVPKSGRKWPTGPKDWKFLSKKVPKKLKSVYDEGFKVVLFTNQKGMEKGHTDPKGFMKKIEDIITALDFPVQAFVATGESHYSKPSSLMWEHMLKSQNDGVEVDLDASYFVGDAAGRPEEWAPGKHKDFSCSDRMFAANCGIGFFTPEEYFYGEDKAPFEWCSVNPKDVLESAKGNQQEDEYHLKSKDFVIMVGPPASGKSSFYNHHLKSHGYVWINRDTFKTPAKCREAAKKAISEGKNVAIDNTNPSVSARAAFISLTKNKGYKVRCFVMDTPLNLCHHLNMVRENQSKGQNQRVPAEDFDNYKENFQEPTMEEGFSEVKKIPFSPTFKSKNDEKIFLQWTQ